jgi:hypothetical protein
MPTTAADTDTDTVTAPDPSVAVGPSGLVGLHHVGITVTDIERSLRWYREMLGMVQWGEEHFPGGRTALLMRPGTTSIWAWTSTRPTRASPSPLTAPAWTTSAWP